MILAFGGDIYIESEENVGTEVCIVLPVDGKRLDIAVDDKEMFKNMQTEELRETSEETDNEKEDNSNDEKEQ